MELTKFYGKTYGKENSQLYVFEETWDSFRPISKVVWNGKKFEIVDNIYKTDLFSQSYGYGNMQMKVRCRNLTAETELENTVDILNPTDFWAWCGTPTEWVRDRFIALSSKCGDKNWKKFVMYSNSKPRTLRHPPAGRLTKRLLRR